MNNGEPCLGFGWAQHKSDDGGQGWGGDQVYIGAHAWEALTVMQSISQLSGPWSKTQIYSSICCSVKDNDEWSISDFYSQIHFN